MNRLSLVVVVLAVAICAALVFVLSRPDDERAAERAAPIVEGSVPAPPVSAPVELEPVVESEPGAAQPADAAPTAAGEGPITTWRSDPLVAVRVQGMELLRADFLRTPESSQDPIYGFMLAQELVVLDLELRGEFEAAPVGKPARDVVSTPDVVRLVTAGRIYSIRLDAQPLYAELKRAQDEFMNGSSGHSGPVVVTDDQRRQLDALYTSVRSRLDAAH